MIEDKGGNKVIFEKLRPFLKFIFFVYAVIIMGLAFYPLEEQPLSHSDKVNHFFTFFVFAILEKFAFQSSFAITSCSALGFGAFIELVQAFLPYRSAELADLVADLLGTATGIIFLHKVKEIGRDCKIGNKR